jgi:hypothetical protein
MNFPNLVTQSKDINFWSSTSRVYCNANLEGFSAMQIWKKFHLIRRIYGPYNLTFLNAQGPI